MEELAILPPAPDACPMCATQHDPDVPHNAQSLYYQMKFRQEHGRFPTWDDAMAHCSEETRQRWQLELKLHGTYTGKGGRRRG
ncbi:MAG: hypothetical protein GXY67_10415 [Clostridiales bacterium]|nr:hypothetical protein [Clostridiales bacterium]